MKDVKTFKRMKILLFFLIASAVFLFSSMKVFAANPRDVVINEVAWSGTQASTADEWIELYNTTGNDIELVGWTIKTTDGTPDVILSGIIPANGYFLLERSDDNTISDISANKIYTGALQDEGESLELKDNSNNLIDTANINGGVWPAGTGEGGTPLRASMERVDSQKPDTDDNWVTNDGGVRNGLDTGGNVINGTPKALNSQGYHPTSTPTPTLTLTPTPTDEPVAPTSTPTQTPTPKPPTSTPTEKPTPTLISTPTPEPSETEEILPETNTMPTPTINNEQGQVLGVEDENNNSLLPKILIGLGLLLILISLGILLIPKIKGYKLNKIEN